MRAVRALVIVAILSATPALQPSVWAADAPRTCAGATPEETWSNASTAFGSGDLTAVASCLAPEARPPLGFRMLGMAAQVLQLETLTTEEEGSDAYRAAEKRAKETTERMVEIQRAHGLPVTAEEAAAIDVTKREEILAAIDYPAMISDLILFIESLDDGEEAALGRSFYFTAGAFDAELKDVAVEGDAATGRAGGEIEFIRIDGLWYLVPPK